MAGFLWGVMSPGKTRGWKAAQRLVPGAARTLMSGKALSSARATGCASHGASLFFARAKKSKQKKARPFIRVRELRFRTSLLPPTLRGPAYKGHPWPFIAGTPSPLAASMPPVPLRAGSTRPSARGRVMSPVGACMEEQSEASRCSLSQLGPESPSGGRSQALRRGTRGMDAERVTKGQGRPFVTTSGAMPERGKSGRAAARPGCRGRLLFGYFLLARQEKVTRRARRNR